MIIFMIYPSVNKSQFVLMNYKTNITNRVFILKQLEQADV